MSASCAKRCRVSSNIDSRYAGKAIGVGTSEIIGRINQLDMRIGIDTPGHSVFVTHSHVLTRV